MAPEDLGQLETVGSRDVLGTTIFWRLDLVCSKSAGNDAASKRKSHLTAKSPAGARTKRLKDDRAQRLAELERKKLMCEKYTGPDAPESQHLEELTEKWTEAAQAALEDLKRYSGTDKSDFALLTMLGIDPALLEVEDDE